MGRLAHRPGPVAILSGGQLYRAHEEREIGFRAALRQGFSHLKVVGTYCGHDDIDGNDRETRRLINENPDLIGIYNVGGGNEGAVRALRDAGTAGKIILIGHNLTPKTQGYLLDGAMDVVLHQNMRRAAGQAVDALIAHLEHRDFQPGILPIEIITCENLQGATFG